MTDEFTIEPPSTITFKKVKRPLGITLMVFCFAIGASALLFSLISIFPMKMDIEFKDVWLAFLGTSALFLLSVVGCAGLWVGSAAGWWAMATYFTTKTAIQPLAIYFILNHIDLLSSSNRGLGFYLVKHGGGLVINALFLTYLFKANVLEFCGRTNTSIRKTLSILLVIAFAVMVVKFWDLKDLESAISETIPR